VTGIGPRRAEIILPGAAVLKRVLEEFEIPQLAYCAAGVRDGIIRDLAMRGAGRERARLDREQRALVEQFARRFGVDLRHARHVAGFARELFDALAPLHRRPPEEGRLLEAAAYLRDVGHAISDTSHHKHSHYIVANSDLAGFTAVERERVALLCRYHRKALPTARHLEFQALTAEQRRSVLLLAPLLRLADALDRSRDQRVEAIACAVRNGTVELTIQSPLDTGLEQWAVEGAALFFRQAYERDIVVVREQT
jgi:exopolyphosphatase/guanosine-5'-triphosphate,3'-diphosphate pyrophosphatase